MSSSPARGTRSVVAALAAVVAVLLSGVVAAVVVSRPASADAPPPAPCDPGLPELPSRLPVTDPLTTTSGLPAAPAYYERSLPAAPFTANPLGYVLVVHGGGWQEHGPGKVEELRPEAAAWRERGWATLNVTYRPCAQSVGDVFTFYRLLRASVGPDVLVCATGRSAGAHLVLLLAMFFPDLDCAIAQAGPIDLVDLLDEGASPRQVAGARRVYELAAGAFGIGPSLDLASPRTWVADLGPTRILLATATDDPLIPLDQARAFAAAVGAASPGADVRVVELPAPPPGADTVPFVHGTITEATLADYRSAEDALVAPLLDR